MSNQKPASAIVTGISGQDGAYMAELLLSKGYRVVGVKRTNSDLWRLHQLGILEKVTLVSDVLDSYEDIARLLSEIRPDEFYHLAAQSSVGESFANPLRSGELDALTTCRLLEALRQTSPLTRLFYSSSAEIFQTSDGSPQCEKTPISPQSPYGCAKAYGLHLCDTYRRTYKTFACTGILFNHESPLRGDQFVTQKIVKGFQMASLGKPEPIQLGNLDSRRDWGYAPEFVEGMWRMLQADSAEDYVLATGKNYSVRDFCNFTARATGFELIWETREELEIGTDRSSGATLVESKLQNHRDQDAPCRIGNAEKARNLLGWMPKTFTPDLAGIMVGSFAARGAR